MIARKIATPTKKPKTTIAAKKGGLQEGISVEKGLVGGVSSLSVTARELHIYLGVRGEFATWISCLIESYGYVEGVDFTAIKNAGFPDLGDAKSRVQSGNDYQLTLNMAKELAIVERSVKGRAVRRHLIRCEQELFAAKDSPRTDKVYSQVELNQIIASLGKISRSAILSN